MKLGYLLFLSFGVVILLIAIIGGIAVSYSNQVSESLGVSSSVPQLLLVSEIIILMLGIVVGYFTTRMISKPLSKLSSAVDEVSKGNFDVEVSGHITKVDEITTLVDSLNRIMITMKLAVDETKSKRKKSKNELEKLGEKMSKDMNK